MFEGAGKEQAIFQNRTPHKIPGLDLFVGNAGRSAEVLLETVGIQRVVLEIEIDQTVKRVAAGSRNRVCHIAGGSAVFRREIVGRNAILLDSLRRNRVSGPVVR